ncbi:cellulose biosynthesis cyclic di-GMP-binding regulatory protein BcsB [Alteromonas sp. 345S023]|uniref:Cyclic di-GMP-binding protein n=1 Tax=Alteromonas profundi TaxID=2696062 RepID=A0A7X5RLY8_9ALTE|nr:cellulose biosynthesis cyclic di-GMP-binding regulatory protein BcsB [Alteromonas profundi]NDV92538.1 cellulose biosynthesis cyclic di-GMP-binding regulatory protein BcsB [Alteromonas profundi]
MYKTLFLLCLSFFSFGISAESHTYRLTNFYGGDGVVRMQGKSNSFDIAIPLTSIHSVTSSSVTLEVTSSQALIKRRSQLFVRFNNATIGQIAFDPTRPSLTSRIVIPAALWRAGFNRLTLAVSQHYAEQCVDGNAPELWSEVNVYNSSLSVDTKLGVDEVTLAHLAGFFNPGIGGQRNVNVFTAADTQRQLQEKTLPLVAQGLALRNQYQPLSIRHNVLPDGNVLPEIQSAKETFWNETQVDNYEHSAWYLKGADTDEVHVVVGTVEELALILSDDVINEIDGAYVKVERSSRFMANNKTLVAPAYRLIVSGNTHDEVYQAAKALAVMDDVLSPVSSIRVLSQTQVQAERLQRMRVLTPGEQYSFEALGVASERFTDEGDFSKRITFRLPADFYVPENASVALLLDFSYGAGTGPGSIMNISVNDELVHGLYFGDQNGEAFRDYQLRIPARFFKGGINNVDISATMRAPLAGVPCDDVFGSHLVFQVNNSSSITLPKAGHVAVQPDLGLFSETGYPFARYASAPKGSIFIPSNEYLDSALTLSGKLAQVAQSPLLNLAIIDALSSKNEGALIVLGSPATLDDIEQDSFAAAVGNVKRWPYRLQNELHNQVRELTGDESYRQMRVTGATVQQSDLGEQAILLAQRHPNSHASDTMFIIAAQTPEYLFARVNDLISLSMWGQLAGDFFVWNDGLKPQLVMQVNEKFELGEANSYWLTLRLWLSNNPWYWLVSFLLLVLLVSLLIYLLLKRRNQQIEDSW